MQSFEILFKDLVNEFADLIPNILLSLLVLVLGYLTALLVKYITIRSINYLQNLARRRFRTLNFRKAGKFIGITFFWLIIFSSILLVTDILELEILTNWFQNIIQYIPNVIAAILIIFAAIILGNFLSEFILSMSQKAGLQYSNTLAKTAQFLLVFMAIIIALDQIGIEISLLIDIIDIVLAAILFGAALAFGLGAKNSISHILAGYYFRKNYKEGDLIQIGEIKGIILKIESTIVVVINETGKITIPTKRFSETECILISRD